MPPSRSRDALFATLDIAGSRILAPTTSSGRSGVGDVAQSDNPRRDTHPESGLGSITGVSHVRAEETGMICLLVAKLYTKSISDTGSEDQVCRTARDKFGIYRQFRTTSIPRHDPENPSNNATAIEVPSQISHVRSDVFSPYPNEFSFRLGEWYWSGGIQKSRSSFDELIKIIGHPDFRPEHVRRTNWRRIDATLGGQAASECPMRAKDPGNLGGENRQDADEQSGGTHRETLGDANDMDLDNRGINPDDADSANHEDTGGRGSDDANDLGPGNTGVQTLEDAGNPLPGEPSNDNAGGARWFRTPLTFSVPFDVGCHSPGVVDYLAGDFHHRRLVDVIREKISSQSFQDFHLEPHEVYWKPDSDSDPIRVYGELYSSDTFLKSQQDVQELPKEPNCDLERCIAALMFSSDSTQLTDHATASLWPLYMAFGNDSKYRRSKPKCQLYTHVAYLESVSCSMLV